MNNKNNSERHNNDDLMSTTLPHPSLGVRVTDTAILLFGIHFARADITVQDQVSEMYTCIWVYVYLGVCVCVYPYVPKCVYVCVYIYVCRCVSMYAYVHACGWMSVCIDQSK